MFARIWERLTRDSDSTQTRLNSTNKRWPLDKHNEAIRFNLALAYYKAALVYRGKPVS
jgi:hypothetical protein